MPDDPSKPKPHPPTREAVLAECREAAERWIARPGRNLVLLFDGTGNILGNSHDTNVVKLMRLLAKDSPNAPHRPTQVVYYDPGVGTTNEFPAASISSKIAGFFRQVVGLALGSGAFDNIAQAYEYLAHTHEEGDRIYLFGFSRGAFTARAVGGMVNMYGLVHAPGLPLIRTLVRNYFAKPSRDRESFTQDVIDNFSLGRTPLVHFVGVWDTVETIGSGLLGGVSISNSKDFERKRFVHVRHAMSLHETRSKYQPRGYTAPEFTPEEAAVRSFDERWFRGVHSDVGGSYERDGLSNVTLAWMVQEARAQGLIVEKPNLHIPDAGVAMHDQTLDSPYWVWTGMNSRERDAAAVIDASAHPVAGATPAVRSAGAWMWLAGGWVLALIVAILFAMAFSGGGKTGCDAASIRAGLCRDWAILIALALWIAYPMAWALRQMTKVAVLKGQQLPWIARKVHWWMIGFVLADMGENLLAWWRVEWVTVIAWVCAVKLGLMAVMALVWVMGVAASLRRPGNPAATPPGG
ncbi:T6SS phospholipase effector Tle1-like catalytic domain-containing protein [Caenimonas aquaedulcis]|uniref:DUF2235 domain-containing protein n=1 Tax=Caenimonas aquaedulcis TaxID=2793270 RepID=A0A931H3C4_9BURK|nr:DUF2235 domain-containing protein [Caenimonas aquaedulcis]MBG9387743.1 DUF2235 domain-containing protein [Caenimonas aquaedulcis]